MYCQITTPARSLKKLTTPNFRNRKIPRFDRNNPMMYWGQKNLLKKIPFFESFQQFFRIISEYLDKCCLGSSSAEKDMKAAERAAITRGRKQIVLMLGTVVTFFFACLLPFKVREDKDATHHIFEKES